MQSTIARYPCTLTVMLKANLTLRPLARTNLMIGYARVSTAEQSLDMQIKALQDYGVEETRIWSEKRSAAAKRVKLERCLAMLRAGDTLVVWKLDRLARSMIDLLRIIEDLNKREVSFVSLTEQIETVTPGGKLLLHVLAGLAQFERDLIKQRTKAGMDAKMATGWRPGPKRKLSADLERAVVTWKSEGKTAKQIIDKVYRDYQIKISARLVYNTIKRSNK